MMSWTCPKDFAAFLINLGATKEMQPWMLLLSNRHHKKCLGLSFFSARPTLTFNVHLALMALNTSLASYFLQPSAAPECCCSHVPHGYIHWAQGHSKHFLRSETSFAGVLIPRNQTCNNLVNCIEHNHIHLQQLSQPVAVLCSLAVEPWLKRRHQHRLQLRFTAPISGRSEAS